MSDVFKPSIAIQHPKKLDLPVVGLAPGSNVDATKEYVAGGEVFNWAASVYRSLPQYIDDLTRDFGDDLYDRMMMDPQLFACVHVLKMGILAQKITVIPAIKDDKDPSFRTAQDLAKFCERQFQRVPGFYTRFLYNMLDAIPYGNKVSEIILEKNEYGGDAGLLCLKNIKVKSRKTVAFVVDPFMNVAGIISAIPGLYNAIVGSVFLGDLGNSPNVLPTEKFAILSYRPDDEDPRGQSGIKTAYHAWWVKQQVWPEYLKFLAVFAVPGLVGKTAPGARRGPLLDPNGNPIIDPATGQPTMVEPEQALLSALMAFRNAVAMAVPAGAEVMPVEVRNQGSPFDGALAICNQEISTAVVHQTLAMNEARYQARASSEVHQDVLGLVINYGRGAVEEMLRDQICRRLIRWNYGPRLVGERDLPDLTPEISLGDVEHEDRQVMANAVASLEQSGFIAPSQRRALDSMLGFPVRTEQEADLQSQRFEEEMTQPLPEENNNNAV